MENKTVHKKASTSNDVDTVLSFGLTIKSKVRVRTMSYAGGRVFVREATPGSEQLDKTIKSTTFSRGGFDPVTSIREKGGDYVLVNDDGENATPDSVTGAAFDSEIEGTLEAGKPYDVEISQFANFPPEYSGSGFESFEDVTGDARTSEYGVVRITLNDLVSNAITINPTSLTGTSDAMLADFTIPIPAIGSNLTSNLGLTLNDAAGFGFFDHFNWFQEIDLTGAFSRIDGIDPLLGGNNPPDDPADNFLWYWDEVDSSTAELDRSEYLLSANTRSDITLNFQDSPNFVIPGNRAVFTTYLAGVRTDGSGAVFGSGFQNTGFKWRFKQNLFGGTVTVQNIDPSLGGRGEVEFLGFLTEEDWDSERIARLNSYGITVAGQLTDR